MSKKTGKTRRNRFYRKELALAFILLTASARSLMSAQGIHFYFLLFQGISFVVVGLDLIGEQVSWPLGFCLGSIIVGNYSPGCGLGFPSPIEWSKLIPAFCGCYWLPVEAIILNACLAHIHSLYVYFCVEGRGGLLYHCCCQVTFLNKNSEEEKGFTFPASLFEKYGA
jgi:hypothetical protein